MKKILIIEDDVATATGLEIRLRSIGYRLWVARDALIGFSLARQQLPDLFILDLTIPAGNGWQLVERFRSTSELARTPFILMTANSNPQCRARAMELNAAGFLEKPYDAEELLAVVRFALGETISLHRPTASAPASGAISDSLKRVLVIEDDLRIATALAVRLRCAGFAVASAYDALTGMSAVVQRRPDLVLLDLSLPAGHGFEVAERIRSNMESPPPIIFLTASKQAGLREKATALGASGFFEKPYEAEELIAAVRRAA